MAEIGESEVVGEIGESRLLFFSVFSAFSFFPILEGGRNFFDKRVKTFFTYWSRVAENGESGVVGETGERCCVTSCCNA